MWSRVGAGSTTAVAPSAARRPARRMQDFTWALATGSSQRIRRSSPPATRSGAWPSVVSTVAPISRSGSAIRSSGRRERLVSDELEAPGLTGQETRQGGA